MNLNSPMGGTCSRCGGRAHFGGCAAARDEQERQRVRSAGLTTRIDTQALEQLEERAAKCSRLELAATEVVAELRQLGKTARDTNAYSDRFAGQLDGEQIAYDYAADLVKEKLCKP